MKKLELTLYKDFYPIDELRNFIASLCRRLGFDRNDVYRVKAAVDEAITNVIRHSYKNKKGSIRIRLDSDDTKITIHMKDSGKPFRLKKAKRKTPDEIIEAKEEGGLGLSMIERLMDEVKYNRREKYNELVMVKYHERKHRT